MPDLDDFHVKKIRHLPMKFLKYGHWERYMQQNALEKFYCMKDW